MSETAAVADGRKKGKAPSMGKFGVSWVIGEGHDDFRFRHYC
jgi:hypothetical protein